MYSLTIQTESSQKLSMIAELADLIIKEKEADFQPYHLPATLDWFLIAVSGYVSVNMPDIEDEALDELIRVSQAFVDHLNKKKRDREIVNPQS